MSAAVAVPAVAGVVGGYMSKRGADKAATAGAKGARLQEQARQEAAQVVSPEAIYRMAEWMYPGLLPKPNFQLPHRDPSATAGGKILGGTRKFGMGKLMGRLRSERPRLTGEPQATNLQAPVPTGGGSFGGQLLQGRQTGGPVTQGQPYVVGEAGPEVMVPGAPGTVVPTPTTPPPGEDYSIPGTPTPGPSEQIPAQPTPDVFGRFGRRLFGGDQAGGGQLAGGQPGAQPPGYAQELAGSQYTGANTYAPIQGSNLGGLAMGHAESFLTDPGQVSTIQYERAQEQANQGLRTNTQAAMGQLTGMGIDPRSGFGQLMLQSVTREAGRARGEAARQLAEQEESLRRADIQTGMTAYQNFLNQVFGIIGTQAGTVGGAGAYPSTPAINPYENLSQAISMGGSLLGDYYANRQQKQPAPQPVT